MAHTNGMRQLQPQGSESDQRGRVGDSGEQVADTDNNGHNYKKSRELFASTEQTETREEFNKISRHNSLADSSISRSQRSNKRGCNEQGSSKRFQSEFTRTYGSNLWWWATEPDLGRVANGVAARVDRLKAIGNGQVPLCAATAWKLLTGEMK
jgi:hypothetical protein